MGEELKEKLFIERKIKNTKPIKMKIDHKQQKYSFLIGELSAYIMIQNLKE